MRIKPLLQYNGSDNFLSDYLMAKSVAEDEVEDFIHPTKKLYQSPLLYNNIIEAINRLNVAVENNEKIGIVVD